MRYAGAYANKSRVETSYKFLVETGGVFDSLNHRHCLLKADCGRPPSIDSIAVSFEQIRSDYMSKRAGKKRKTRRAGTKKEK